MAGSVQQRITQAGDLHDEHGRLIACGYATSLLRRYDRSRIAAPKWRIKEWDYYYIGNDSFGLALTAADNGYMSLDSISLLDFENRWENTATRLGLAPMGKRGLPASSQRGDIRVQGKGYTLSFLHDGCRRVLFGSMENFCGHKSLAFDLTLSQPPRDSMVIVTPFGGNPRAFYYNQKVNCLRAKGRVMYDGREYLFSPATAFGVLDWGRGVWPYKCTWYWGSASGVRNGHSFGFNIGCGFGDRSTASENMLFYDGIAHKLSQIYFHIPQKNGQNDFLSPWRFTSDDGRFEMDFVPVLDRAARTNALLLSTDQHQVFGRFHGRAVLDDGTIVTVRDFTGFAEIVHNKW